MNVPGGGIPVRLYPAPAAAMVMGRPPAATGAEPTTSRVLAAAAWQAWHAAAAWQPVALAPGRVAAHVPIPALSVAAPQPGALAPGRVAAHVPIPAPSVAAQQPGSTQTAADASRKQEAKRRDARERQRAHRSRVRVNASEEAAQPATLSRDVFVVEAWSEGPLPRESWSGWSESPVARVHHDGFAILINLLDEKDLPVVASQYPAEVEMEGLFGPHLWTRGYERSVAASRRLDFVVDPQKAPWRELEAKVRGVLKRFHLVGECHVCDGMQLLLAFDKAPRQSFHIDFHKDNDLFARTHMHEECLPYPISVIVALDEDTTLTVSDGRKVSIPKLGAIVFRGDMRHAGSAYKKRNWRLFFGYGVDRGSRRTKCHIRRRGSKRKGGPFPEVFRG